MASEGCMTWKQYSPILSVYVCGPSAQKGERTSLNWLMHHWGASLIHRLWFPPSNPSPQPLNWRCWWWMVFWGPPNSETIFTHLVHACMRTQCTEGTMYLTQLTEALPECKSHTQAMTPHPPAPSFPHPTNPPFHLNPCIVTQWNYIIQLLLLGSTYSKKTYWVTSNCNSNPTGGGVGMWDSLQVCLLDLPSSEVQDWQISALPTCSRHYAMVQGSQGTLSHHCFSPPQPPTPTPTLPLLPHPPPNKGRGTGEYNMSTEPRTHNSPEGLALLSTHDMSKKRSGLVPGVKLRKISIKAGIESKHAIRRASLRSSQRSAKVLQFLSRAQR